MYKYRHIISTFILTFVLTCVLCFTFGGHFINYINAFKGNLSSKLSVAQKIVDENYINTYDEQKLTDSTLNGYITGLGDKYAQYISPSQMEEFLSITTGNYKGIGITVITDNAGLITVTDISENSPAKKGGILPGDIIIKAEDTPVNAANYNEALNIIKGIDDKDDNVKITVMRQNKEIEINLVRETIESTYVKEKVIDNIYYISLSSFEGKSSEQFDKAISNAESSGCKGIIIDLRNNPGGTLENVLSISDRILDEGTILTIKSKSKEDVYKAKDDKKCDMPICVLVNNNSASAAEVLTAALKDNKKATVVGDTTYGKGVVQTFFMLDADSLIKMTTAKYYTPNGICIDGIGIVPDIEVKLDEKYNSAIISIIEKENDKQLTEALKVLS
jgi:carboxyl-terminal processing protease